MEKEVVHFVYFDNQGSGLSREQHNELVSLLKLLSCLARHLNLNNFSVEEDDDEDGTTRRHSQVQVF